MKQVKKKSLKNLQTKRLRGVVGAKRTMRADEFAEFMMLFNKAYTLGVSQPESLDILIKFVGRPRQRALLLEQLRGSRGIRDPLKGRTSPLIMTRIRKSSPLMLWFVGVQTALVVAVILSGGEVDLLRGRFKVRSLGEGLKNLRDAFAKSEKRPSQESSRRRTRGS